MPSTRAALGLVTSLLVAAAAAFVGCIPDAEDSRVRIVDSDAQADAALTNASADATADSVDTDTSEPLFDCSNDPVGKAPMDLRCAGLYDRWSTKTIRADVHEFKPAMTLWTDGAQKTRWVYLPPGTQIDTTDMDAWRFPIGTRFFKELVFAGKRIETRMFWKVDKGTWERTTYRWSADETSATRLDTGYTQNDPGDPTASGYEIPSVAKCDQCHAGSEDKILGFEAVGLGAPGATGYNLVQLVAHGKLTVNPETLTLTVPEDGYGSANALGWLHANCGTSCHNRNPNAACNFKGMYLRLAYADLTPSRDTTKKKALDPVFTTFGVPATLPGPGYNRITAGKIDNSAVYVLANRRNNTTPNAQMPPIDTHVVDPTGVGFLSTWITAHP